MHDKDQSPICARRRPAPPIRNPYILKHPIIPVVDNGPGQLVPKGQSLFPDYEKYASTFASAVACHQGSLPCLPAMTP